MRSVAAVLAFALLLVGGAAATSVCAWYDLSGCSAPVITLAVEPASSTDCPWRMAWAEATLGTVGVETVSATVYAPGRVFSHGSAWHNAFSFDDGPLTISQSMSVTGPFPINGPLPPLKYGTWTVDVAASNAQGSDAASGSFELIDAPDAVPPWAEPDLGSTDPPNQGWYRAPVTLGFRSGDDCGRHVVRWELDGAYRRDPLVTEEGLHHLRYNVTDTDGNRAEGEQPFGVDVTPPQVRILRPASGMLYVFDQEVDWHRPLTYVVGPVTLRAQASDAQSGIASIEWFVDGVPIGSGAELVFDFPPAPHRLVAKAMDVAGHATLSEPVEFQAV